MQRRRRPSREEGGTGLAGRELRRSAGRGGVVRGLRCRGDGETGAPECVPAAEVLTVHSDRTDRTDGRTDGPLTDSTRRRVPKLDLLHSHYTLKQTKKGFFSLYIGDICWFLFFLYCYRFVQILRKKERKKICYVL